MSEQDRAQFHQAGGKKGGKARAAKLTSEQRRAIAKKAAAARWGKKLAAKKATKKTGK